MKRLNVKYDKICEKMANGETIRDIYTRYRIPVKYITFKRAVCQYRSDGTMRHMMVSQDFHTYSTDIWSIYETGFKATVPDHFLIVDKPTPMKNTTFKIPVTIEVEVDSSGKFSVKGYVFASPGN